MRPQFFKGEDTQAAQNHGADPEIEGHCHILPEPFMINHAVSIPFYYINNRVQSDDPAILSRHPVYGPENRGQPEAELDDD
jgi:hypothetical protein